MGIIPGTWTRREQKPAISETLTSRLIDRSLRPLLPSAAPNLTLTVLSATLPSPPSDALAVNAAAASLAGTSIWPGPVAAAQVAVLKSDIIPFPTAAQLSKADLSVFVAINSRSHILSLAVEAPCGPIPEPDVATAIAYATETASKILPSQHRFHEMVTDLHIREGRSAFPRQMPVREQALPVIPEHVLSRVHQLASSVYKRAFVESRLWPGKAHRADIVTRAQQEVLDAFPDVPMEDVLAQSQKAAKEEHRAALFRDGCRMDGRAFDDVRDLRGEVDVLPGDVHGSAIFERGDTQVLACTTIGLKHQGVRTEEYVAGGLEDKSFFVHYAFPPYATGEPGRFGGFSSRREIGHSALAEMAIRPVLDLGDRNGREAYPYALRLSAEVMASDGSSSMATVCAGSMALMDAGAPLKEPVAGVAIGLVSRNGEGKGSENDSILLTDILGAEDHFGEMDMKVAGTATGVTACQMDTKLANGISLEIIERALTKARVARSSILDVMNTCGHEQPKGMPVSAPRMTQVPVNGPVAIKTLMKDRAMGLRDIEGQSGARLTFKGDKNIVTVEAPTKQSADLAVELISKALGDLEVGTKLEAVVVDTKISYAVVEASAGSVSGVLHVSKMQVNPVSNDSTTEKLGFPDVRSLVSKGDVVDVVVLESNRARNVLRFGLVRSIEPKCAKTLESRIDSFLEATRSEKSKA